jgi:hypothetical protein
VYWRLVIDGQKMPVITECMSCIVPTLRWDPWVVRQPCARAVPPDDREELLESGGVTLGEEELRGATVEVKQHRVSHVGALDEHSLPHAVDVDVGLLREAAWQAVAVGIGQGKGRSAAP